VRDGWGFKEFFFLFREPSPSFLVSSEGRIGERDVSKIPYKTPVEGR
jgi:hypothetical protein